MAIEAGDIVGVLLAGGQSRRMGGGDKSLRHLAGRPILEHVIERLSGQVGRMVLNANGDPARFEEQEKPKEKKWKTRIKRAERIVEQDSQKG